MMKNGAEIQRYSCHHNNKLSYEYRTHGIILIVWLLSENVSNYTRTFPYLISRSMARGIPWIGIHAPSSSTALCVMFTFSPAVSAQQL